jgi:hypothetical protein
MTHLFFWMITAYGLSSILVWGSIFEKQRNFLKRNSKFLGDLISCTLCTSTWVGFFMSIILGSVTLKFVNVNPILATFFDGMFTAGAVWTINSVVEFFEENRLNKN